MGTELSVFCLGVNGMCTCVGVLWRVWGCDCFNVNSTAFVDCGFSHTMYAQPLSGGECRQSVISVLC